SRISRTSRRSAVRNRDFGEGFGAPLLCGGPVKDEVELKNGARRKFPAALGKALVAKGVARTLEQTYKTSNMRADESRGKVEEDAPYGYKADGTPRKRPGRRKSED